MLRTGAIGGFVVLATMLAGSVVFGASFTANAADLARIGPTPVPWLLGDWSGARTRLQQQGIDFQFGYVGELAYNARGGVKSEAAYSDQYSAGATLNLDRLFGIRDATFQVSISERTGRNLVEDAQLGALQLVQEVFGRGRTIRLTEFWFSQKYLNGLIDWRVGRTSFGKDFAAFSCNFQNLTFCGSNPTNIASNYIFNWPISQWGTRVKFALNEFGYIQVGVYDVNPQYLGVTYQLAPVFFQGSTGALVPVELAWLPKFGAGTLRGSYKFGAWYDTSSTNDAVSDINGNPVVLTALAPLQRRGRYGAYINFQQQVTRTSSANPDGGLNLFLNAVMTDDRTAAIDRQIAVGMMYTGPLKWRPNDDVGFAVGTTHVNSRVATVEALQNVLGLGPVAVQHSEYTFELYYTLRPINGLLVRPNIQYVLNPGGTSQNKDALILGLKTVANF